MAHAANGARDRRAEGQAGNMSISVRQVSKTFGTFQALRDVSLDVQTGELVALLGPSGSGKTTLLRIIAGLETPDCGTVYFHGEATNRRVRSGVGFVFQHYALFRHMTVFENVAFGLRAPAPAARRAKYASRSKCWNSCSSGSPTLPLPAFGRPAATRRTGAGPGR